MVKKKRKQQEKGHTCIDLFEAYSQRKSQQGEYNSPNFVRHQSIASVLFVLVSDTCLPGKKLEKVTISLTTLPIFENIKYYPKWKFGSRF